MTAARTLAARFASDCGACGMPIAVGDPIRYTRGAPANHVACGDPTRDPNAPTTRDRRLARAERLDGWAERNAERGTATVTRAAELADLIPFGQPILVDHYSARTDRNFRNRIASSFDRGYATLSKADEQARRAESIRRQAEHAIYSDDHDACDKLRERIAHLEAQRDRVKAYNASCRKGTPDVSLLDDAQRASLESAQRWTPGFMERKRGQMPPYVLSNLSGEIKRNRDRLAMIEPQS